MTIALALTSSTPSFSEFDPSHIPYQDRVIDDLVCHYDYSYGVHEILLSGAVGSAKSILMAHCGLLHALKYPGSRGLLGRKSMPDLKATILTKLLEHMEGSLVEGRDYWFNRTTGTFTFRNRSEIICRSWADGRYLKMRSLELSWAVIEELTENDADDMQAWLEIKMRIGRLPHVKENWMMAATNPDSPSHWVFDYFELQRDEHLGADSLTPLGLGPDGARTPTKHVYYSVTDQNPFLPDSYKEQLRRDLDPKQYMRMGRGRWIELKSDGIYYAYDRQANYRERDYVVNPSYPVILSWDFNIGDGKPLSMATMQLLPSGLHVFGEVVVEGMRTEESCEELAARGYLDGPVTRFVVSGDASGKNRDTRSKVSDYDIINKWLANYRRKDGQRLTVEFAVPLANPALRTRHNRMNAWCRNEAGEHRLFVYRGAPTVDKGMRLTALKSGGQYVEDDSKPYQHITTAVGYGLLAALATSNSKLQGTVYL